MPTSLLSKMGRLAITQSLEPTILRVADRALHEALCRVFDAAADRGVSDELERQFEDLMHTVVQDILDGVLKSPAAAEIEEHLRNGMAAALHREGAVVQGEASAALSALVEVISCVLRDHQKDLVGVATRVLTKATVEVATDKIDEGSRANGAERKQVREEQDESVGEGTDSTIHPGDEPKHDSNDIGRAIRDQLSDAGETLRSHIGEGSHFCACCGQGWTDSHTLDTGNAKIDEAYIDLSGISFPIEQNIVGFEVTVDNAPPVDIGHRLD